MKKIYARTFIAALIVTAAVFTACPTDAGGGGGGDDTITIANTAQWNDAINKINNGGNGKSYVLTIAGTVSVPPSAPTFNALDLTVTLKGSGTLALNANGALFYLVGDNGSSQTLVIDGPVTLKGRNAADDGANNNTPLVIIDDDAALEMKNGTITGNNNNTGNSKGGGVFVDGGSFAMSGGEISGNAAYNGSGAQITSGSFTMTGGRISGNGGMGGGAVDVSNGGGGFAMSGGEISDNIVYSNGVSVSYGSSFTLSGNGKISGHSASGVDVFYGGHFIMTGGEISGNTDTIGGGVTVRNLSGYDGVGSSFAKSGGIIYGDDDPTPGNGNDTDNTSTTDAGHAVCLLGGSGTGAKKYDGNADETVKLYAKWDTLSWTYNGAGVDGIDADTESAWQ
jgi:hypothetical protein